MVRRRWFIRLFWLVLAATVLAGVAGVSLLAGYVVNEQEMFPHKILAKVEAKLEQKMRLGGWDPALESRTYSTAFLTLVSDVGKVDTGRDPFNDPDVDRFARYAFETTQTGGGITSFGKDALLLPFDGTVYAASSSRDIRATGIVGPEIHRAEFVADSKLPEYAEYDFRVGVLRYNDLLFVEAGATRALIASFIEYNSAGRCYTNALARLDIDPGVTSIDEVRAGADDWDIFFRTEPCLPLKQRNYALEGLMSAGRIAFEAPTTIYMASGDYHFDGMRSDGPAIAQDPVAQYGKVLSVDLETGTSRVVSMGHRNPSGIARAPDGRVFVAEHGPRGGDELNLVREGANFGWPIESYGTTYYGFGIPGARGVGRHETFEPPAYSWLPSVATSSVAVVQGFDPTWDGDLLVGTLKDRSLHRVRLAGDHGTYAERVEIGSRIRYVHQHTDGRLVLWTDNEELIFLTARPRTNIGQNLKRYAKRKKFGGAALARLEGTVERCGECHSFEVDDHSGAPSLARVFGAEIASTPFKGYSSGLRAKSGTWTHTALDAFLTDPQSFAPGTQMPPPAIDDEQRGQLIEFLEYMSENY